MAERKPWFLQGKAGADRAKEEDEAIKQRIAQRGQTMRFWLKNDTSAKITWLDNPNFFLHEHQLKIGNSYRNYFTCLKEIDTCPVCETGDNPSYIVVGTVIVHKAFTDRDGKEHKNQKMLFVGKSKARNKILRQIEKRDGDLKYCVYEMARGSMQQECSTGEDMEFLKRLTQEQVEKFIPPGETKEWLQPIDYVKVFAPKTVEELRKVVGGTAPVGSDNVLSEDPIGEAESPAPEADEKVAEAGKDGFDIDDFI